MAKRFTLWAAETVRSDIFKCGNAFRILFLLVTEANASQEVYVKEVNGHEIELGYGEATASIRYIHALTGISSTTIHRQLGKLCGKGGPLTKKKRNAKRNASRNAKRNTCPDVYIVRNYAKYQAFESYGNVEKREGGTLRGTQEIDKGGTNSSILIKQQYQERTLESNGRAKNENSAAHVLQKVSDELLPNPDTFARRDLIAEGEASPLIELDDQRAPDWCWNIADGIRKAATEFTGLRMASNRYGFIAKDIHRLTYTDELVPQSDREEIRAVLNWACDNEFWRTKIASIARPSNFAQCRTQMLEAKKTEVPLDRKRLLLQEDNSDLDRWTKPRTLAG